MIKKSPWLLCLAGIFWFLYSFSILLQKNIITSWDQAFEPAGFGEILQPFAAAGLMVLGALGVDLPLPVRKLLGQVRNENGGN